MKKSIKTWLIVLGVIVLLIWALISGVKHLFKMKNPYNYDEESRLIQHTTITVSSQRYFSERRRG